jgi:hypothetical protein
MKHLLGFLCFIGFLVSIEGAPPTHKYCYEELTKQHPNSPNTVDRLYSSTGESACFELKTHVARCLDKSLYALVQEIDPAQLSDKTKIPSVEIGELEAALSFSVNVGLLPGFKDVLSRCSHQERDSGLYKQVISVGDFTKKCSCDLGNDDRCRAYKHVGQMMHCGEAEPLPLVL